MQTACWATEGPFERSSEVLRREVETKVMEDLEDLLASLLRVRVCFIGSPSAEPDGRGAPQVAAPTQRRQPTSKSGVEQSARQDVSVSWKGPLRPSRSQRVHQDAEAHRSPVVQKLTCWPVISVHRQYKLGGEGSPQPQ